MFCRIQTPGYLPIWLPDLDTRLCCRIKLYVIKATALRAAALAPGVRPWRADPARPAHTYAFALPVK